MKKFKFFCTNCYTPIPGNQVGELYLESQDGDIENDKHFCRNCLLSIFKSAESLEKYYKNIGSCFLPPKNIIKFTKKLNEIKKQSRFNI